jgi:hypothetical protein
MPRGARQNNITKSVKTSSSDSTFSARVNVVDVGRSIADNLKER